MREKQIRRLWAAGLILCPAGGLGTALANHLGAPDWAVRALGLYALAGIAALSFSVSWLWRKKKK